MDSPSRPLPPDAPAGAPADGPELFALRVRGAERLDRLLARDLPFSRTRVRALVEEGRVTVQGRPVDRPSFVPGEGDLVEVRVPGPAPLDVAADPIALDVLYEDAALIAVNKPAGLVVHPAPGHPRGTLVNALLARGALAGMAGERPGIVHRLDRDTSGVIVVAKRDDAHRELAAQFKAREVVKLYDTIVWGHVPGEEGTVERPIARSRANRQKMAVDFARGRSAVTRWRRVARYAVADRLEVDLASGRTHQIRVHLASLGHPVAGDERYGGGRGVEAGFQGMQRAMVRGALNAIGRLALHARRLELRHPDTGRRVEFEAPLPDDLRRLIEFLE